MSSIVAVAGGANGLGRAIVDALRASGEYTALILSRKANAKLEEEVGVPIVAADYASTSSLVALLEEHKVDTVISVLSASSGPTPEFNLIQAADQSKATRRYIPNIWSNYDWKPEHVSLFPVAEVKLAIQDALKKTSLEWTAIYPGVFLEYYTPNLPTHVTLQSFAVDTVANVAGIPGSGNYPVNFTYSFDIGKYVVAALSIEKWETKYYVVGDTKTWNEIVALVEKEKGVKFDVSYDSVEKLEKGEVTEIPGHKSAYDLFGGEAAKPMVQGMLARLGLFFVEGLSFYEGGRFLNDIFPEIKALGLQEAWEKVLAAK